MSAWGYGTDPYEQDKATDEELRHLVWEEWEPRVKRWVADQRLDVYITVEEPIHDLLHVAIGYTHFEEMIAAYVDMSLNADIPFTRKKFIRKATQTNFGILQNDITPQRASHIYDRMLMIETITQGGKVVYQRQSPDEPEDDPDEPEDDPDEARSRTEALDGYFVEWQPIVDTTMRELYGFYKEELRNLKAALAIPTMAEWHLLETQTQATCVSVRTVVNWPSLRKLQEWFVSAL